MGLLSTTHIHKIGGSDRLVPYAKTVNITEKRAPTDKSVELLNEFQEKARENIIYSARIEQNHLKAIAIYYKDAVISDRINYAVKFELNSKDYLLEGHVDKAKWRSDLNRKFGGFGIQAIYEDVYTRFAEIIALELMKQSPDFIESIKKQRF